MSLDLTLVDWAGCTNQFGQSVIQNSTLHKYCGV